MNTSQKICKGCGGNYFRKVGKESIYTFKRRIYCSRSCARKHAKRKKFSSKTIMKMRLSALNKFKTEQDKKDWVKKMSIARKRKAEKYPATKNNGSRKSRLRKMFASEKTSQYSLYEIWREAVLILNDGKCENCNALDNLDVDHIKSYRNHKNLRFALDNGRVLCRSCHTKTESYGSYISK